MVMEYLKRVLNNAFEALLDEDYKAELIKKSIDKGMERLRLKKIYDTNKNDFRDWYANFKSEYFNKRIAKEMESLRSREAYEYDS